MDERLQEMLARRAESADVSTAARERVMAGVRPRRRWVKPVLAASVAVAATVAGVAVVTRDVPRVAPAPPGPSVTEPAPTEWREESWQGLTVSVPADWGYGGAPVDGNSLCAEAPDPPGYVGRPIGASDLCGNYRLGDFPYGAKLPFVWLGADVDVGTVDIGYGWVQETVEAFDTTLTVASDDPALRDRILASARPTTLCPTTRPDLLPTLRGPSPEWRGNVVCAYRLDERVPRLTYAAPLTDDQIRAFTGAFEAARPSGGFCDLLTRESEWVVLHIEEDSYVTDFRIQNCPGMSDGQQTVRLTPAMVEPWAVGGIPHVVYGPSGGKGAMIDSFIPGWR